MAIIWIPAHLRGNTIDVYADNVAIGGRNGSMTFISFQPLNDTLQTNVNAV